MQMKMSTKLRQQRTKAPMTMLKMVRLQILSSFQFTHQLHCLQPDLYPSIHVPLEYLPACILRP